MIVIWASLLKLLWCFSLFVLRWPLFTAWLIQAISVCAAGRVKEMSPCEMTTPLEQGGTTPSEPPSLPRGLSAPHSTPSTKSEAQRAHQKQGVFGNSLEMGCFHSGFWGASGGEEKVSTSPHLLRTAETAPGLGPLSPFPPLLS